MALAADHVTHGHGRGHDRQTHGAGGRPNVARDRRAASRAGARLRASGSRGRRSLTRGDRFILRQYSPPITIGGGRVIDPLPARTPIRTAAAAARFAALDERYRQRGDGVRRGAARARGCRSTALARRAGLTAPEDALALASALEASGRVRVAGEAAVRCGPVVRALEEKLVAAVTEHHSAQPMSEGLPREEARDRVFRLARAGAVRRRPEEAGGGGRPGGPRSARLAGAGRVADRGGGAGAGGDRPGVPRGGLGAAGSQRAPRPPRASPRLVADRVSKLLVRQKTLVKVDTLLFHARVAGAVETGRARR